MRLLLRIFIEQMRLKSLEINAQGIFALLRKRNANVKVNVRMGLVENICLNLQEIF